MEERTLGLKRYKVKMRASIEYVMVFDAENEEQAYDFAHEFILQTDENDQTEIANAFIDNADVVSIEHTNEEVKDGKIRRR